MTEETPRSMKERLANKKYMGECKWGSEVTVRIMRELPIMLAMKNAEENTERRSCISQELVIPRNTNSDTTEWFAPYIGVVHFATWRKLIDENLKYDNYFNKLEERLKLWMAVSTLALKWPPCLCNVITQKIGDSYVLLFFYHQVFSALNTLYYHSGWKPWYYAWGTKWLARVTGIQAQTFWFWV